MDKRKKKKKNELFLQKKEKNIIMGSVQVSYRGTKRLDNILCINELYANFENGKFL